MKHHLILYHYWRSSCSWRVRWALAIKGVKYESVHVNLLKGEQNTAQYLKRNPLGFVPCLEVDGVALGESLAILEWIDENYPHPALLPKDGIERAKVRQLALMIVAGIQPLQNLAVQKYYCPDEKKKVEDARYWIKRGLTAYEDVIEDSVGKYSFGDSVTMADLCLIPQCYNAERFDLDLAQFPRIQKIYQLCRETKECKASEPVNPEQ